MTSLIKLNPVAFKEFNRYRENKAMSNVFGFIGGFILGYASVSLFLEQDISWYIPAIGAGFIVLSFGIQKEAMNNLHNAIDIYNSGLNNISSVNTKSVKKELIFGFNDGKLGIAFRF